MAEKTSVYTFIALSLSLLLASHLSNKIAFFIDKKINKKPMSDVQKEAFKLRGRILALMGIITMAFSGQIDWSF